jgi:hypothetical protein
MTPVDESITVVGLVCSPRVVFKFMFLHYNMGWGVWGGFVRKGGRGDRVGSHRAPTLSGVVGGGGGR